jgi:kynurenine/2-aminoadipate aminotransferase
VLTDILAVDPDARPLLYTIPTGSNPTGASITEPRRDEIMQLAREFDALVVEDDPYYYLQYSPERSRSLLSRDTDGRVMRFDSFSKVLSSGLRVGTVCGPPALVTQLSLDSQASCLHPSGLSQAAVLALFQHWGVGSSKAAPLGKLEAHVAQVTAFYASQCDAFMQAAELAGLEQVASFSRPSAGMFIWMECKGVTDTAELIEKRAAEKKFLMVPGTSFYLDGRPSRHVRASFSTASAEDMKFALEGLVSLLRAS